MSVEGEEGGGGGGSSSNASPPEERQEAMAQLLTLLSFPSTPENAEKRKELMARVVALYQPSDVAEGSNRNTVIDGIPGLFSAPSKLKGISSPQPLPSLVFDEVFKIDMGDSLELPNQETRPLEEVPFTVPLEECSKATLFNMAQIYYHWGKPDTALQFFHLAASVSHKISPLAFDPIDIGCVNNMAQIHHLQFGQPDDAMKMLTEALERGNRTLAAMYRQNEPYDEEEMDQSTSSMEELDARRTRRLRRKLARTLNNIGHVHFSNCNYDDALASCRAALPLIDAKMEGRTLAAIWHNISMIHFHQGKMAEALAELDKFLDLATKLLGPDHLQLADALYRKALILFEMGKFQECVQPIEEATRIRKLKLGDNHGSVAEALCLAGKSLLARSEFDAGLELLTECLDIQRKQLNCGEITFEVAQTLLEIGRAHHAKGDLEAALEKYLEVLEFSRKFFGPRHAFVARISGIVGDLYVKSSKMDKSKPYLEEAAQIQKELGLAATTAA